MKRWVAVVILLGLALAVAACSNADRQSETSAPPASTPIAAESDSQVYASDEGWTFEYPKSWDKKTDSMVQETGSGKFIKFESAETTKEELEKWIQSEIERKTTAGEADQTLLEPLTSAKQGDLTVYKYTIQSESGDRPKVQIPNVIFYNGKTRVSFYANHPLVSEQEFKQAIDSFKFAD